MTEIDYTGMVTDHYTLYFGEDPLEWDEELVTDLIRQLCREFGLRPGLVFTRDELREAIDSDSKILAPR